LNRDKQKLRKTASCWPSWNCKSKAICTT